jgi:phosphatidylserine/phosphatidylglycerophosphate/cardiolipin synthase-like enzyme
VTHPLQSLGRAALAALAEALLEGRVGSPITRGALAPYVAEEHLDLVLGAVVGLQADGMAPRHIGAALSWVAAERAAAQQVADRVELVWSPPDLDAVDARDTSVVVQELFRQAARSVLIATFALEVKKEKARVLFGELAARMDADPSLRVRVFANVHRKPDDASPARTLVKDFAAAVRQMWPGERLPELFYDPRSVDTDWQARAVLHAKTVVADGRWVLLTSANFTEAAQERNIEAGVVIDDRRLAERVTRQFDGFVERGVVARLR